MSLTIDHLKACFEGAIPASIATCDADGVPNVAWLSQVQYVDPRHIALSFQFFSKTRGNILANPRAELVVTDPFTVATYRLKVRYRRTETSGPLFENMKARLAGVASHTGMSGVYRLQGADIYEVLDVEELTAGVSAATKSRPNRLSSLRTAARMLAACRDLPSLVDTTLQALDMHFGVRHAMVLMRDCSGDRLYALGSRGYTASGVGFETVVGSGVIGVAARERTPIRISFMAPEYSYARATRQSAEAAGLVAGLAREIPFPGLTHPHSQLALPILRGEVLLGVIYLESDDDLRFDYDDEDALMSLAALFATAMEGFGEDDGDTPDAAAMAVPIQGPPLRVRHYGQDRSVFLDDDYVIKGVAGAILWRLLTHHRDNGRTEFSNRELRGDPALGLPDVGDNLEARLLLLQRRLDERAAAVRIEKTGRGRFRLNVARPLALEDVPRIP